MRLNLSRSRLEWGGSHFFSFFFLSSISVLFIPVNEWVEKKVDEKHSRKGFGWPGKKSIS